MAGDNGDGFWWAGPDLRARLAADPAGVLRDRGVGVPPDMPRHLVQEFVRVAYLVWADGEVVPVDRFHIDPADEGLLFGRGVWESTRTVAGIPWLWPWHLSRLQQTADLLGIQVAPDRLPDAGRVAAFVRSLTTQDVLVRLNVSAGPPGRPGRVWMAASPLPVTPPSLRLQSCRSPVEKGYAYLTLKTFQYATRIRLGQLAARAGFDSALLLDGDGNILEAAHANVFLRLADGWVTPAADGGFLPGTVRQHILMHAPVPVREQKVPAALLADAREVFVTNSNAGIVPVTQVDNRTYHVGPETQQLQRWLNFPTPGVEYRFAGAKPPATG